jgi:hypothetical protein
VVPLPVVRVMVGPSLHIGEDPVAQFTGDIDAGVWLLAGKDYQYMFDGEAGFTIDGKLLAFNLMGAIGIGKTFLAYASYQPRLVLGTRDGYVAGGMRNALAGHFLFDALSAEFGYQFIASHDGLRQDVTLMFGTNPAAFIYFLAAGGFS